jgi:hypothetical protein
MRDESGGADAPVKAGVVPSASLNGIRRSEKAEVLEKGSEKAEVLEKA